MNLWQHWVQNFEKQKARPPIAKLATNLIAKNTVGSVSDPAMFNFLLISFNAFSGVKRNAIPPNLIAIGNTTRSIKGCESSISPKEVTSPLLAYSAKRSSSGSYEFCCRIPITTKIAATAIKIIARNIPINAPIVLPTPQYQPLFASRNTQ